MQHKFPVKLVLECCVLEEAFVWDEIHISLSYLWVLDANNYELGLRQSPDKVVIMIGTSSQDWEEQVFIGSHRCDHSWGVVDWQRKDTAALGRSRWCQACFAGTGWTRWKEGGRERVQWRTHHLDERAQRLAWHSQSEQQWTEDSQSADFPSPAFSLAVSQNTRCPERLSKRNGFFHQLRGIFFNFYSAF